jgi:hypothetical protein
MGRAPVSARPEATTRICWKRLTNPSNRRRHRAAEKLTETFNVLRNSLIDEHKQALENISNSEHKSRNARC